MREGGKGVGSRGEGRGIHTASPPSPPPRLSSRQQMPFDVLKRCVKGGMAIRTTAGELCVFLCSPPGVLPFEYFTGKAPHCTPLRAPPPWGRAQQLLRGRALQRLGRAGLLGGKGGRLESKGLGGGSTWSIGRCGALGARWGGHLEPIGHGGALRASEAERALCQRAERARQGRWSL